jgi:hypothetical protein
MDTINPEYWRVITAERLPINAIPVQFSSSELNWTGIGRSCINGGAWRIRELHKGGQMVFLLC